jgi:glycine betaine/proline transport system ATP-binding protein
MQGSKISVRSVSKIFAADPAAALTLLEQGVGKAEIQAKTGAVIGLHNVSLEIPAASTFVVMGLSGSGKSTLIRHINRLIEPTAGEIRVDGDNILSLAEAQLRELRRHKISMVFQRFGLLPHKTVRANVAYPLIIQGMARPKADAKADAQISLVGLSGFEEKYPHQLSGGMQQRVGLARALATDADILLMDEAFSALDPLIRNDMQIQLRELQHRLKKTIVFITHDLDEALLLGDRIAILKDGELKQCGTPSDILLKPADDYVQRFIRDVNRLRVVTVGSASDRSAVAASNLAIISEDAPLEVALPLFSSGAQAVSVVDSDGKVLGLLTRERFLRSIGGVSHEVSGG